MDGLAAGRTERLHAVLLWDLDNMPGPRRHRLGLARELQVSVEDQSPRVVAARRGSYRELQRWLADGGVEVLSGGRSKSGADRRLSDRGRTLARQGHEAFVVASNDGHFACLARVGEVHVMTVDPSHLSARLARNASTITALEFDGHGWVHRTVSIRVSEGGASPDGSVRPMTDIDSGAADAGIA